MKQQILGKPRILSPKDDIAFIGILYVGIAVLRLCREEKAFAAYLRQKIYDTVIVRYIQVFPIIKSGAFKLLVGGLKSHRFYKMKPGSGDSTGARDIAGILRDLRFNQNYIQFHVNAPFQEFKSRFQELFLIIISYSFRIFKGFFYPS